MPSTAAHERVAEQCAADEQIDQRRAPAELDSLLGCGQSAGEGSPVDRAIDQGAEDAQG